MFWERVWTKVKVRVLASLRTRVWQGFGIERDGFNYFMRFYKSSMAGGHIWTFCCAVVCVYLMNHSIFVHIFGRVLGERKFIGEDS